ncbi:MAG: hypothetical protein CMQ17_00390 [Gammaproteobacteria bacterium]|jgi:hypothetical protein|nr:hypothetical protein [Gammaproteobacteria bacterium]|tara:strand:- start:5944 stop:6981 length:1038 start_codon:yes stop_codon:yes gene_type:complete
MTFLLEHIARIVSLLVCTALACSGAVAQKAGRPDLEGIYTNASLTNLTRPRGVETLVVSPQEARVISARTPIAGLEGGLDEGDGVNDLPDAAGDDFGTRAYNNFWVDPGSNLALVKGEYRSSYVVNPENGRVPRLENPQYDFERRNFGSRYATGFGDARGPEAIPNAERCLLGFGNKAGPGMMGALYNNTYQFVQTENYVMILVEMVHDARIIPIFDSPEQARAHRRPVELEQWFGDSVGWYEGDELVVETVNIHPLQLSQSSVPITKAGRIMERFSRYSENEVFYQFTVEDSNIYSQPWTAELSFIATDAGLFEYACHEGNYAMPGILAGARRLEKEEQEKANQ